MLLVVLRRLLMLAGTAVWIVVIVTWRVPLLCVAQLPTIHSPTTTTTTTALKLPDVLRGKWGADATHAVLYPIGVSRMIVVSANGGCTFGGGVVGASSTRILVMLLLLLMSVLLLL
jgi:hypothetical protein